MFSGLFYLIITLLLITLSSEGNALFFKNDPWQGLGISLGIYLLFIICIYFSARKAAQWIRNHKSLSYGLINGAIILYLALFHYVFAAHRITHSSFLIAAISLFLYFSALAIYHYGSYIKRFSFSDSNNETRLNYTSKQIRIWLPFVIPFLSFSLFYDLIFLLPENSWSMSIINPDFTLKSLLIFFVINAAFFLSIMVFLPYFIQKIWLCKELEDGELRTKLLNICRQANFRCKGLYIWEVMNQFHTAAIIGIVPRFRYIMFTKKLIQELPIESIEAILIHEIGHSYRKHLWILPCILLGMFLLPNFLLFLLFDLFPQLPVFLDSEPWNFLLPIAILIPYIAIMAIYFRIIFGFYSRIFERQADLHSYVIKSSTQQMITALDQIGTVTGNTHTHPSWHHYSIQERIDFLTLAAKHPKLIKKHHRYVRFFVTLYFFVFFIVCSLFYLILAK